MAAPGPEKKYKSGHHPNSRAGQKNLRPHPKKGTRLREFLTPVEIQFCQFVAEGATNTDAARWAGWPGTPGTQGQWGWKQRQRPMVQKLINTIAEKLQQSAVDKAVQRKEDRERQTHYEYIHRLRTLKTHKYRGDESIVKLIDIGFRSTGAIQPNKTVNNASATAVAQSDGIVDIYKPLWLRERESELLEEARQQTLHRYPQAVLSPASLTPDKAKEYLLAAQGDKEAAREAARKDGWQV